MALLKVPDGPSPEGTSFFRWLHSRTLGRNKNVMVMCVGNVGSGKSYYCLRIKERSDEILGRKTNIDHICFTIYELIELINSKTLKRGDVVVLEEGGVNAGSRDWQSKFNKTFNYLLQTFRNLHLILIINLPDERMLDINTRRLMHGTIEMRKIDHEKETSTASFKLRQHNFSSHKDYNHYLRVVKNGKVVKLSRIKLNKPSRDLLKFYEAKRKNFTDGLNQEMENIIYQAKQKELSKSGKKPLTGVQQEIYDLDQKGLTKQEIADKSDKSLRYVYQLLEACQKKGHMTSTSPKSLGN